MKGKIGVCSYEHKHGADCWTEVVPIDMGPVDIERAVTDKIIEEYGKEEVDEETERYGGVDYHHSVEPGMHQGVDGHWYKVTIERIAIDQLAPCKFCGKMAPLETAHRHDGGYVGECCWDERLKATE